jgi:hypothetical protein
MVKTLRLFGLYLTLVIATGLSSCSSSSDSDSTGGAGVLNGRVFNEETNATIEGATVSIVGTGKTAQTDSKGEFKFKGIALGTFYLQIWKNDVGFNNFGPVQIKAGEESFLPFALQPLDGRWSLDYEWRNYPGSDFGSITFNSDGTCNSAPFGSGTWTLNADSVTLTMRQAFTTYNLTGEVTATNGMIGTMRSSAHGSGTWTADR